MTDGPSVETLDQIEFHRCVARRALTIIERISIKQKVRWQHCAGFNIGKDRLCQRRGGRYARQKLCLGFGGRWADAVAKEIRC